MALLAAVAASACSAPTGADEWLSSQVIAYGKRSVEIIALASRGDEKNLAALIARDAQFSMGSGDVLARPSYGVSGAHQMASDLQAASYSFHGWDYIPEKRDACGPHDVEVEFITSDGTRSAPVKFHFNGGLLESAAGWWRSRIAGSVNH